MIIIRQKTYNKSVYIYSLQYKLNSECNDSIEDPPNTQSGTVPFASTTIISNSQNKE